MKLKELVSGSAILQLHGNTEAEIVRLISDSRQAVEKSLYVAVKGTLTDGHAFIEAAIQGGACAIVCETLPLSLDKNVTYLQVKDSAKALGQLAANFYGHPSKKLKLIGITGTNGKTSTATLLYDLLEDLGKKSALISTVENRIGGEARPATHTTPDILRLNEMLAEAVYHDCEFVVMEVSSHGLHQQRTAGLEFAVAAFTNISHDHLDYHKTFAEYIRTKKTLFDDLPASAAALVNIDDKNGPVMLQNTKARRKTFAQKTLADYHGKVLEADFEGMLLNFNGKEFWTQLTGKFNVYNLLLAYGIALECGFPEEEVLQALSRVKRVRGRFETFKSEGGIYFIVDYAHTPDALQNILDSINQIRTRNERLITVFGCGGDRDREKRPEMGKIAARESTLAIITSDNPRGEAPADIIKEIEAGVEPQNYSKYTCVPDRREAIKMAIKFAEPKDIILVAGKGHENYQEIHGEKLPCDDRETLTELARLLSK